MFFDQMLARLERAFEEQQRFTANASHELRTPQSVVKTMLQVARADPDGRDVETLLTRLQELNDRSIVTLDACCNWLGPSARACPGSPATWSRS